MRSITDFISEHLSIEILPEVSNKNYSMFDDASVECEVGEFFYSFVRLIKPRFILETGTYQGILSSYIGLALKKNKSGILQTIEFEKKHLEIAKNRWVKLGIQDIIVEFLQDCRTFIPTYNYQLMILDTEPFLRFDELVKFYPYLDEGGYIFIHDTPRNLCQGNVNPDHPEFKSWPFKELPEKIKQWVKEELLRPFYLPSPRGLIGLYKVRKDDYKWI